MQNKGNSFNTLFSGFRNDSSDEEGEVKEQHQFITDPEQMRCDTILTNKQVEIFLKYLSAPNFNFTKIWLNKFNLVANKHYGIISKNDALFKLYKTIVINITQDIYPMIEEDKDMAPAILEIFSELYYRKDFPPYQHIIDEYRIDVLNQRVVDIVNEVRKEAYKTRKREKNQKSRQKEAQRKREKIKIDLDPYDSVCLPIKRDREDTELSPEPKTQPDEPINLDQNFQAELAMNSLWLTGLEHNQEANSDNNQMQIDGKEASVQIKNSQIDEEISQKLNHEEEIKVNDSEVKAEMDVEENKEMENSNKQYEINNAEESRDIQIEKREMTIKGEEADGWGDFEEWSEVPEQNNKGKTTAENIDEITDVKPLSLNPKREEKDVFLIPEFRNEERSNARLDPRAVAFLKARGIDFLLESPTIMEKLEKFHIILDIDNTLVAANSEVTVKALKTPIPAHTQKIFVKDCPIYVAQRPGVSEFLELISKFAELYAYSHGSVDYAAEVIKILDPSKKYFKGRVLGSENNINANMRKSLEIFSSKSGISINPDLLLVIDDQMVVWDNPIYCIPVVPYYPMKIPNKNTFICHPRLIELYNEENLPFIYEPPAQSNLLNIAEALKESYSQFISNNCKKTAIFEFTDYRNSILKGTPLSFNVYETRVGQGDYTANKLKSYKIIAESLGASTSTNGFEVVETTKYTTEVSTAWLLDCYLHIRSIPRFNN
ncbi:unnamed protein product [Blepharisma stoltei]|uniref:protein-serine/threonine phosphatase n=1 Tax=Blepharisma stoltei TaxID=1481888 RepID=A0AAU9J8Z1_9CILI|nr:unnamed protein product [Blepharisma stoltei]